MRRYSPRRVLFDRIWTIPNFLSVLRICLIPLIAHRVLREDGGWTAALWLTVSGLTDIADGYIARRMNQCSTLGQALDPFADKLTQGAVLGCLLFRFPPMLLAFAALAVKEITLLVIALTVIRHTGTVEGARWHGKTATVLLYLLMTAHLLFPTLPLWLSWGSVGVCTAVLLLSFLLYLGDYRRRLRGASHEG